MPRILPGLPGLEDHRDGQEGMAGGTEPGDQHAATMETEYPVAQETGQGRDPGKEVRVMPDREKVIRGLKLHGDPKAECDECPYRNEDSPGYGCLENLCNDAISLLKEQEESIPVSWLTEKLEGHPELPYAVTDGINWVLDLWEGR